MPTSSSGSASDRFSVAVRARSYPDLYIILDNQWLYSVVTQGIVGLVALALMHLVAIWLATLAFRRSKSAEDRHLAMALICAQVISLLVGATFDSLSFTTFSTTWALLTGMCGAVWRLTHSARTVRQSTIRRLVEVTDCKPTLNLVARRPQYEWMMLRWLGR